MSFQSDCGWVCEYVTYKLYNILRETHAALGSRHANKKKIPEL